MPKRYDHLYPKICSFSNLYRCFYKASKGKVGKNSVAFFSYQLEQSIQKISESLHRHEYNFGPYRGFYVHEPKKRLIESACFRDRVVHHAINEVLEMIYDPQFIEHSYACRSGRGHHRAVRKLYDWMRGNPNDFFLKCDIKKFFPSIDREILLNLLRRNIMDSDLLLCLEKLIFSAPGDGGVPIGNLTSQVLANVYMNEVDQYIKRRLRVKHYIRYMDDFVILTKNKEEAQRLRKIIEEFVMGKLKLQLSPQKVMIGSNRQGVAFLGFFVTPFAVRMRGKFFRRIKKKILQAQHKELRGENSRYVSSPLQATINSYAGHIKYCTNEKALSEFLLEKLYFQERGANSL